MARSYVARRLAALGGRPEYRQGFVTDNGNAILDVKGIDIMRPLELETKINNIVGVLTNSLFTNRPADMVLYVTTRGVVIIYPRHNDSIRWLSLLFHLSGGNEKITETHRQLITWHQGAHTFWCTCKHYIPRR